MTPEIKILQREVDDLFAKAEVIEIEDTAAAIADGRMLTPGARLCNTARSEPLRSRASDLLRQIEALAPVALEAPSVPAVATALADPSVPAPPAATPVTITAQDRARQASANEEAEIEAVVARIVGCGAGLPAGGSPQAGTESSGHEAEDNAEAIAARIIAA